MSTGAHLDLGGTGQAGMHLYFVQKYLTTSLRYAPETRNNDEYEERRVGQLDDPEAIYNYQDTDLGRLSKKLSVAAFWDEVWKLY